MINSSGEWGNGAPTVGKTCLLVDDDDDDKEIFCMALSETDPSMRCVVASYAVEALQILEDTAFIPDYIFLDLNMPLMSGKECLQEIRKLPHLNKTPVIIYSTSASPKDIQETRELGASYFITKPSRISVLAQKLAGVLSES